LSTIRVARRARFTTVDRTTVNDQRLSFRARGILVWLLDKPDDWRCNADEIARAGQEGRDAVRTALNELLHLGYIRRERYQNHQGHWQTETWVFEHPTGDGFPGVGSPDVGAPVVGEPGALLKTETEDCDRTTLRVATDQVSEAPETEAQVRRSIAKGIVDAYWQHVKDATGKAPAGVRHPQLVSIIVPFVDEWDAKAIKWALATMRTDCRPFTRQVLEEYLDGRRAARPVGGVGSGGSAISEGLAELRALKEQR
jgi:hypothetical protein